MKILKRFGQLFENEGSTKSKSFGEDEHKKFCEEVLKWMQKTGKDIKWSLWGDPRLQKGEKRSSKMKKALPYWENEVYGNKKFTIIECDDELIGVLHTGENIEKAFDSNDKAVDKLSKKLLTSMIR